MTSWQKVWREGVLRLVSLEQLQGLARALQADSRQLIQGATTQPPPLQCCLDWPCEASCPVAYLVWQGRPDLTVGEVEEGFARLCFELDRALDEGAACRWLLNWVDEVPREEMRRELLAEIGRVLGPGDGVDVDLAAGQAGDGAGVGAVQIGPVQAGLQQGIGR